MVGDTFLNLDSIFGTAMVEDSRLGMAGRKMGDSEKETVELNLNRA